MNEAFLSNWLNLMWAATWQSALLCILVWILCRALPNIPARVRALLWWLVAAKLVLSLLFVSGIPLRVLPTDKSNLAFLNHRLDLLAPDVKAPPRSDFIQIVQGTSSILPSPTRETAPNDSWAKVAFWVWCFGVLVMLGVFARQWYRARTLRLRAVPIEVEVGGLARQLGVQLGLNRPPCLLESYEISAPMVVGVFRPTILLPSDCVETLNSEEMQMSLAHEMAHIKRADLPLGLVLLAAQALFFFLPTVWVVGRKWETEREAACDALALEITRSSPSDYGRMLMKIVVQDSKGGYAAALGATANYHSLKERLLRMKFYSPKSSRARAASVFLVSATMVLILPWQLSAQSGAATRNEVRNGGFENATQDWSKGSLPPNNFPPVTISIDSQTFKNGKASMKFEKSENRFFPVALMAQSIPYDGKQTRLKVGFWAKVERVKKFTLAVIMNGSGDGKIEWGGYIGDKVSSSTEIDHDWKYYTSVVAIPANTSQITLALQMYGPGTVWVDDVSASYVPGNTPVTSAVQDTADDPDADLKDVPNEDRTVGGDAKMRYFLIGKGKEPAEGYKLLLVLPGGDGSAEFNPFVRRIWKGALPPGYLVAELVAPKWSDDQFSQIVWPTNKKRWATMKFSTEQFLESVIADVQKQAKVDPKHIYTLSWSSGGPAAYAASLSSRSIRGSFIAMSIYRPEDLPPASAAKGRGYYLLHSPTDFIQIAQPRKAVDELTRAGAKVTLDTYEGGHGWHGDVFGMIRKGVEWLEKNSG